MTSGQKPVLANNQLIIDEKLAMPYLKNDPKAVSVIERKLLDIIVKYNYYRDIQMDTLFNEFKRVNGMLDANVLNTAIENVRRIMDD